ncbi:MAG: hypothetical protein LBW85_01320 [Deltaproteobacteria bacterium]|jgi:alanine-alpha-ketoisovalerate/valine-pyruvate aminotransferase|nr:hypothetical protein [Deltaproteobacteria bacterium]
MASKYTREELRFVERLSGRIPDSEIAERFAARFGREPTALAIQSLRRNRLMPTSPKYRAYTDAEIAFVRSLSGRVPDREIAARFAARFGRQPTAMGIKGLRQDRLMPMSPKFHAYTDAEIAFVRMLSGRKPNREIAALFNRRFHADVSGKAISRLRSRHDMPLTIMRRA